MVIIECYIMLYYRELNNINLCVFFRFPLDVFFCPFCFIWYSKRITLHPWICSYFLFEFEVDIQRGKNMNRFLFLCVFNNFVIHLSLSHKTVLLPTFSLPHSNEMLRDGNSHNGMVLIFVVETCAQSRLHLKDYWNVIIILRLKGKNNQRDYILFWSY